MKPEETKKIADDVKKNIKLETMKLSLEYGIAPDLVELFVAAGYKLGAQHMKDEALKTIRGMFGKKAA